MADEKKVSFLLDLDIKQFTEKALEAKGTIDTLSESGSMEGLIEGLTAAGALLGTVGLAVYSFKKALDLTIEAEHIKRIHTQFELLAGSAGIAAKTLQEGMEKAAGGLMDTEDILEVANKSIVAMGSSANKLPEIMEIARKATAVFGGDLKANFDNITQAISSGNVRMLRHYGLVIDNNKALQDFAKANGLAANELNEVGRREALLNATLEQSKTAFAGVNLDLNKTEDLVTELKITIKEFGDFFAIMTEKILGPQIRLITGYWKDAAVSAKEWMVSFWGPEGLEKTNANLSIAQKKLQDLKVELADLEHAGGGEGGFFSKLIYGSKEDRIKKINAEIAATTAEINGLSVAQKKSAEDEEKNQMKLNGLQKMNDPKKKYADAKALAEDQIKLEKELQAINDETFKFEQANLTTLEEVNSLVYKQRTRDAQEHQNKVNAILKNANLSEGAQKTLLAAENKRFYMQLQGEEKSLSLLRQKLLKTYVTNSHSAFSGIGHAFQVMSANNKAAMQDFGTRGEEITTSFQQHASSAFTQMGADMVAGKSIAESAANAMKGFFLNMLADRAQGEGTIMMLSGIWPPNPPAIAAGIGLITLSGVLRALAGSAGGGTGGGMSVPASPSISGGTPESRVGVPEEAISPMITPGGVLAGSQASVGNEGPIEGMAATSRVQRAVNIHIAGNYYDTESTRRNLMEMVRQESDATDFAYTRIGAG